jgi:exodeoxyribonuclease VII large subunit
VRTLFDAPAISVGELCRRIKGALEASFPEQLRVAGEVSKCTVSSLGHAYFALKDRDGLIACVCFRSTAAALSLQWPLPDGMAVEVLGRVTAYRERSQYQILVDDIVPVGRGELYRRFELLKEKLRREGLFDESRKRPLPSFIREVAIVTSRGAAALQDFLTTCRRRGAHVAVTLVHAPVQGGSAALRLTRAIRVAGRLPVEAVVVARGGGSIEDLWAFNTEAVARAIAVCRKPVITAIGHETDVTIADFVADRRAATPTAAAEMVAPDRRKLLAVVRDHMRRITRSLARVVGEAHRSHVRAIRALRLASDALIYEPSQRLDDLQLSLRSADPRRRAADFKRRIAGCSQRLRALAARAFLEALASTRDAEERQRLAFAKMMVGRRNTFDVAVARLAALGPANTLRRGYAIVFDERGSILTDSAQTAKGEHLDISLRRGRVYANVTGTEEHNGEERFEEQD